MKESERYHLSKRVTLIGAFVNVLLGLFKLIGGIYFSSHALIADGFHSFSDLFTDAMVVFASKYGSQAADENHPYGHQRIETAATFFLAVLLILTGAAIAWHSTSEIITPAVSKPEHWALYIAIASIFANEFLYHYTHRMGKHLSSSLLMANAWHHRSDALSSLVVLIGLVGSLLGYIYCDAIAAILVGLMIIHMGISYGWNSIKELVDTAVNLQERQSIEKIIRDVNGVKKVHQLRSRMMGSDILIDVHIQVDPYISVSEGHFIAQHVHQALVKQYPHVRDVTVHVDPEDDEIHAPSYHLPSRKMLEHVLTEFPSIESWLIHYLEGQVHLDLFIIEEEFFTDEVKQNLSKRLRDIHKNIQIRILLRRI